jgi:hypothetical protein
VGGGVFNEISPVERIDTGLDLRAQRFQFQRIFSPPLLEHAERVTHHFARILILACLHDTFDEGVLLGNQADVTSGHVRICLKIGIGCQPWQSLPMPSYAAACPRKQARERPRGTYRRANGEWGARSEVAAKLMSAAS